MCNVTFQTIVDALKDGREIEFSYKDKQYSITNSNGYWNFCCDTENRIIEDICEFNDKITLISWAESTCIDNILLSVIFDEKVDSISSVCIL